MNTGDGDQPWRVGVPLSQRRPLLGRLVRSGGTLWLTDDAVVFEPHLGRVRRFPLTALDHVDACADRPPRLRIVPRTGKPLILVLPTRWFSWVGTKDSSVRDDALDAIIARLGRAGADDPEAGAP